MHHVPLQESYGLYIGGHWRKADDRDTFETRCPANKETLSFCAQACDEDVDDAVDAAWRAFPRWSNTTPKERAAILLRIADIIDKHRDHLAMVESLDNGKPIAETMQVDIPLSSAHFRYFAACILA